MENKKPFHLIGDRATYCDIDDTLVHSRMSLIDLGLSQEQIDEMELIQVPAPYDGTLLPRYVNKRNVTLLKECKLSGAAVVAWSQGGARWSAAVIEALGLNDYVDITSSKPTFLIDDLQSREFMPKSVWKKPV